MSTALPLLPLLLLLPRLMQLLQPRVSLFLNPLMMSTMMPHRAASPLLLCGYCSCCWLQQPLMCSLASACLPYESLNRSSHLHTTSNLQAELLGYYTAEFEFFVTSIVSLTDSAIVGGVTVSG